MSTHTLRRHLEDETLERMERIFRVRNDEEFCQQICKQIVEMVMRGEKVYLTPRASEILRPTLEEYGITLVPARVEYPCILIDTPEEGRITIKYLHRREEEIERKVKIVLFLRLLEETLKLLNRRRGLYTLKREIQWSTTELDETHHYTLAVDR
ncbi:MAG: hypothetical protein QXG64_04550 [Acidilobaceae archaeon]